jgi:hypothetical protein
MMNNLTNVRADPTAVRSRSQLSNIDIPINRNSYLDGNFIIRILILIIFYL